LIATLLLILAISIMTITPLKAFITKSTTLSKLPPDQRNNSIPISLKSSSNNTDRTTSIEQQSTQAKISVVASFFPIYEFVKAVGGGRIDASVLVPMSMEPHDFDPTIQEVQKANSANLLVYNGASIEEPWIHDLTPQNVVDASKGISLMANPGDPQIKGPSDLKVIYSEDLIDPRSSQAIAEQIPGTKVMVLSPIEDINATEQRAGVGYLDKMYQDLAALELGLQCKA